MIVTESINLPYEEAGREDIKNSAYTGSANFNTKVVRPQHTFGRLWYVNQDFTLKIKLMNARWKNFGFGHCRLI